ncbi:MAG: hypothetical protein QME75_08835 [Deltaproteobacteria bacterium]|nr:hypothetical protein [Deltaproteobacteria bacterium]
MIQESETGAYLGATGAMSAHSLVASTPNFDVFDREGKRLILGKCSRLPDDEDIARGRYGIDFHRALPPFRGPSGITLNWGEADIEVNAYNYARCLPRALRFREFTANLAFASRDPEEYQAKRRTYTSFYSYLYYSDARVVIAAPHCGQVRRPPDVFHPFPLSEIDAWTARVGAGCLLASPLPSRRFLISLHSTDYFGSLMDFGDFGLAQNGVLTEVIGKLQDRFADPIEALMPAYRQHIIPYTLARVEWFERKFGTLDSRRLARISTAAGFELRSIRKVLEAAGFQGETHTAAGLRRGLESYWHLPPQELITLNGIFSGRKTACLLNLAYHLDQAGLDTAVQVECSRFLAQHHPELTVTIILTLLAELENYLPRIGTASRTSRQ